MYDWYYGLMTWIDEAYVGSWGWVRALDRQEWIMLLTLTSALGFCCMRGFGSRHNY